MTILEAIDISKTYHTTSVPVEALKTCSLKFSEGEFTIILGRSGSGKSTLLRILGAQDTPETRKRAAQSSRSSCRNSV